MLVAAVGAVSAARTIARRAAVGTLAVTVTVLVLARWAIAAAGTVAGRPAVNAT